MNKLVKKSIRMYLGRRVDLESWGKKLFLLQRGNISAVSDYNFTNFQIKLRHPHWRCNFNVCTGEKHLWFDPTGCSGNDWRIDFFVTSTVRALSKGYFVLYPNTHARTHIHTARFVLNSFVPFQQVFLIIKRKITCALMEKNLALIHLPPLLFTYA